MKYGLSFGEIVVCHAHQRSKRAP